MKKELKLRKGRLYFVTDSGDKGKPTIPVTCKYYGVHVVDRRPHLNKHLFLIRGNEDSGYWVSNEGIRAVVEPYSDRRAKQIAKAATKWLRAEGLLE